LSFCKAIADTPSFIFLWVGDGVGLEQGRQCLKKVGTLSEYRNSLWDISSIDGFGSFRIMSSIY